MNFLPSPGEVSRAHFALAQCERCPSSAPAPALHPPPGPLPLVASHACINDQNGLLTRNAQGMNNMIGGLSNIGGSVGALGGGLGSGLGGMFGQPAAPANQATGYMKPACAS